MRKECMFVNTCMENLRKNLRAEMKRRKFSVVRMAVECNLSYDGFCKILHDQNRNIRLSILSRIANANAQQTLDLEGGAAR